MMGMFKKGYWKNNYERREAAYQQLVENDLVENMGKVSIARNEK